jgi:hypothetical protein
MDTEFMASSGSRVHEKVSPSPLLVWVTFLQRTRALGRATAVVFYLNLIFCVAEFLIQLLSAYLRTVSKGVDPAAWGVSGILLAVCLESWC